MNLVQISQRLEITFWSAAIVVLKNRRALRIIIATISLALILWIVSLLIGLSPSPVALINRVNRIAPVSHHSVKPVETSSKRQYNTLVILVDKLDLTTNAENLDIQSIWLAVFLPTDVEVNFVPLFHSERFRYSQNQEPFRLNSDGTPSKELVESVARLNVNWDHYVVVDFTVLDEYVKGLTTAESGSKVAGLRGSNVAMQAMQADILCSHTRKLFEDGNSHMLLQSFRGKFYSDLDLSYVSALFQKAQMNKQMFTCEFPTLGDKFATSIAGFQE